MNLSDLTTTLETSLALQKAGVDIDTVFAFWDLRLDLPQLVIANNWTYRDKKGYLIEPKQAIAGCLKQGLMIPAYTNRELAEWVEDYIDKLPSLEDNSPIRLAIFDYWEYSKPFEYTDADNWADLILSLIRKKVITLSPTDK